MITRGTRESLCGGHESIREEEEEEEGSLYWDCHERRWEERERERDTELNIIWLMGRRWVFIGRLNPTSRKSFYNKGQLFLSPFFFLVYGQKSSLF